MANLERDRRLRPWILFPVCVALGLVMAAIHVSNGESGDALFALALFVPFGVLLGWGKSEWVLAISDVGDERQRRIGDEALKLSYLAVITVAVIGFVWTELRHGDYGPFGVISSVGGFTQMVSLVVLTRRR